MTELDSFVPNWTSPPGDTIREILESIDLSIAGFADGIGCTEARARELIMGSASIDEKLAPRLSETLGGSERFWLNRERQYRADRARVSNSSAVLSERDWLRELPLADMTRYGWIAPARSLADKVKACLDFFGASDIRSWQGQFRSTLSVAAFRSTPTFESNPASVAAWLRFAELEALKIQTATWNVKSFRAMLGRARRLTWSKRPELFIPELRNLCAACGVALVVAPSPKGCRASGATRFLTEQKALIVLSFRYLSDDQFWFTFFHEAGHLILHGHDAIFLEDGSEVTATEEAEANEFAARTLISAEQRPGFDDLRLTSHEIIRFARGIGIAPGIVVGQLQYLGRVPSSRLNALKRRYSWSSIPKRNS